MKQVCEFKLFMILYSNFKSLCYCSMEQIMYGFPLLFYKLFNVLTAVLAF
jgi:hypothetical protein